ncbi:MAG: membrane protein insertase YidC [Naasia sp.]
MDPFAFPPFAAALDAAYSAVEALSTLLAPFAGGSSAAFAVLLVTLGIRSVLLPLGVLAARSQAAMRRIAPQLSALRARHAKNPERLQRETADLLRRERVSPFGGILPLLAQVPVVGLVYAVFTRVSIGDGANLLLAESFGGVSLARSFVSLVGGGALDPAGLIVLAGVVAVLVAVAEIGRRWAAAQAAAQPGPTPPALLGFLSYGSLVAVVLVPFAAAIYLTVSAVWGLIERILLARRFAPTGGAPA